MAYPLINIGVPSKPADFLDNSCEIRFQKDITKHIFSVLKELNLGVVGSQIVGLVPLRAMLQAAEFYMEKESLFLLEEDQKIRLVSSTFLHAR